MRNLLFSWLFLIPFHSFFFNIHIIPVSGQCLDDQRSLLLEMRNSLKFDHLTSTKLVKWDQSMECCSWAGVACDNAGHVIGLNLSNESISGGIQNSSSLFSLQYLQSLNLAYNNFNWVEIPSGLDKLTSLTCLNLSNANFAGQIPIEISRMTRLVTLDLSTQYHFFESPSLKLENPNLVMLVRNLTELTELHLDGVNIAAHGNGWCRALSSSLPNLRVLSMPHCHLSGPIDSSLVELPFLSVINMDNNNLSTPVPEFFASFSNLTSLRLSSSELYGTFPKKIFQVTTLQTLDLSDNGLLQGSLPEFPQNASLQNLVLRDTNFSGELPNSMDNLKWLSTIDLAGCNFNGSIPNSMASLTQLVYIDFSSNSFVGPIPSFSSSKNLTQLNLAHNHLNGSILSTDWEGLSNLVNLDLGNNSLSGNIPLSLFGNPSLQKIQLSLNQFTGQFNELSDVSSSLLDTLDLSSNKLEGPFPKFVFGLQSLKILALSSNNFNGTIELNAMQQPWEIFNLDLSYNSLSITLNGTNSTESSFPNISTLKLASCKLRTFPDFLKNQPNLIHLDLSDNQIHGTVPNWIWKLEFLFYLNLSHNFLVDLGGPLLSKSSSLIVLDLHSNQFRGQIPMPPQSASYLDYSWNNFSSVIPAAIGSNLTYTIFFSLSSNNFNGSIPESICNATFLQVLDLSNNSLSGMIPQCLIMMSGALGVLNLQRNNLSGSISDTFLGNCGLKTLDLNGNFLNGRVPKSMANCKGLEILDLGNNQINDTFPCWLTKTSSLRVLVLRSNKFRGSIGCPRSNSTWPMLQIVDLASNSFSGKLPSQYFRTLEAMMTGKDEAQSKVTLLGFEFLKLSQLYYQDTVTVTYKGQQAELVKIQTIFTSIDFSCNNFQGEIPRVLGHLKLLHVLNLSYNAFTGKIPSAFGKIQMLESLDLSWNNLGGEIPMQLASLNFLSVLNLSYNQLVGKIPTSTQLQSFLETSFAGNKGLCGDPLKEKCTLVGLSPPRFEDGHSNFGIETNWDYIGGAAAVGFVFGLGVVISPLVFWKRWRKWYSKHVDQTVSKILSSQDRGRGNHGRIVHGGKRFKLRCW